MRFLLWVGVILVVLGIASFFVPIPQREKETLSAGGVSVGVETTHSQTLPVAASVAMVVGGSIMAAAGGLRRRGK
jgi:nucleoside recognition membrane protein YjiH